MRKYSLVVAASCPDWGIGFQGNLPWRIREDMQFFKDLTCATEDAGKRNAVIMGRKTWESIPAKFRPLPNRLNVVLTRSPRSELAQGIAAQEGALVCGSLEEALERLEWPPHRDAVDKVFVMGGSAVYEQAMAKAERVDRLFLTKVFPGEGELQVDTHLQWQEADWVTVKAGARLKSISAPRFEYQFVTLSPKLAATLRSAAPPASLPAAEGKEEEAGNAEEEQYLAMIRDILAHGVKRGDRTGTGTLSKFGTTMRFDLRKGKFPLLTTKRVFWRGVATELLWFIKGSTNAKELSAQKVRIWDGNGSREFLDSRGLTHREEGDLGPVYGFQWRHFGAQYKDMHADYTGQGVDQLAEVIRLIKEEPTSRRIVMSAWNPADQPLMALPPCHMFCQFYVANGELSCQMYQRSADMGLGVPFNIASYALLTRLVAQVCGLEAAEFVHVIGDCHVYLNHVEALQEQVVRTPRAFPTLQINPNKQGIDDFAFDDFKIEGYKPHKKIAMKMAV